MLYILFSDLLTNYIQLYNEYRTIIYYSIILFLTQLNHRVINISYVQLARHILVCYAKLDYKFTFSIQIDGIVANTELIR